MTKTTSIPRIGDFFIHDGRSYLCVTPVFDNIIPGYYIQAVDLVDYEVMLFPVVNKKMTTPLPAKVVPQVPVDEALFGRKTKRSIYVQTSLKKLPDSCSKCKYSIYDRYFNRRTCTVLNQCVSSPHKRSFMCPLVELDPGQQEHIQKGEDE